MAVEKHEDGTYRVGGMTFSSADSAFAHDAATSSATSPVPGGEGSLSGIFRTGQRIWGRSSALGTQRDPRLRMSVDMLQQVANRASSRVLSLLASYAPVAMASMLAA